MPIDNIHLSVLSGVKFRICDLYATISLVTLTLHLTYFRTSSNESALTNNDSDLGNATRDLDQPMASNSADDECQLDHHKVKFIDDRIINVCLVYSQKTNLHD